MNTDDFPPGEPVRPTLDNALRVLRTTPRFWHEPLDRAIEQLLATATLLPADCVQLWQLDASRALLRLHSQCNADGSSIDRDATAAIAASPDYLAALARMEPFIALAGDRLAASPAAPAATEPTGTVHVAIAIEGVVWGALALNRAPSAPWTDRALGRIEAIGDLVAQLLLTHRTLHAENRFQTLAENAPVGILQLDENLRVLYRNPQLTELFGRDPPQFTPEVVSSSVVTEDGHDINLDSEVLKRTGVMQTNVRITRPDGSERHVLWHVVTEQTAPGAAAPGRIGIALDITALWQAQQQLRELTIRQRAILDHAAHAIIATDMEGRITLFNPAAERLLGYRAEEALGQTPFFYHIDEELQVFSRELQHGSFTADFTGFAEKTLAAGMQEREWTFQRKDGTRIPVLASTTLMKNAEGEPLGLIGIAIDQSDRKRIERMEQREQSLIMHISRGTNTAVGEQFFDQLIAELRQATGAHYTNIFMLRPELDGLRGVMLNLPNKTDFRADIFDFAGAPLEPVMRDGMAVHLLNARHDYPDRADVKAIEMEEFIAVPLVSSAGTVLGALMVGHRGRLPEPELAAHLLEIFAVRASSELERLRNERALRVSEAEQRWLHAASEQMHAQHDVQSVARAAAAAGAQHHTAPRVSVMIDEGDTYRVAAYTGPEALAPQKTIYKSFSRELFANNFGPRLDCAVTRLHRRH